MRNLLEKAGLSFLRAFGASILVLATGVSTAPNLNQAYALGVAALIASIAAGIKAVQVFAPQLSFVGLLPDSVAPYASWVDSFVRAFVGAFLVAVLGVLNAPDLQTAKALLVAAIVGAVTAGIRALQGLLTQGETPFVEKGL